MNRSRFQNIVVGITAVIGLVCLCFMLLLFGAVPGLLKPGYAITFEMVQTGGITPGSRVEMNGIDIGEVREVRMIDPSDPSKGVIAEAMIREEFQIPLEAGAAVNAGAILGGSPSIEILVKHLAAEQIAKGMLPMDGSARMQAASDGSIIEIIASRFEKLIVPAVTDFHDVAEEFKTLSRKWADVGERVAALTEERDPAAVDSGEVRANLHTVMVRADNRLAQLEKTLEGINSLVGDETLRKEFRETLDNFKATSESTRRLAENADKSFTEIQKEITGLTKKIGAVTNDLSDTISSANALLKKAESGEGTVGKLLNDPSLYNNLADAAERAEQTLTEAKQLMEKLQAEGLPLKLND